MQIYRYAENAELPVEFAIVDGIEVGGKYRCNGVSCIVTAVSGGVVTYVNRGTLHTMPARVFKRRFVYAD